MKIESEIVYVQRIENQVTQNTSGMPPYIDEAGLSILLAIRVDECSRENASWRGTVINLQRIIFISVNRGYRRCFAVRPLSRPVWMWTIIRKDG